MKSITRQSEAVFLGVTRAVALGGREWKSRFVAMLVYPEGVTEEPPEMVAAASPS
jgi:hypothetical protein